MYYSGTWKDIWTLKGMEEGTKDDILKFDGWEKSLTDISDVAELIKDTIKLKQSDKLLEVGCGAGGMAQFMDCKYVGIDFSPSLVEKCMKFFGKAAICSEANSIPFRDNYFDKCFSWGVFLYFPDYYYMKMVVDEMKRTTKGDIFIGDIPKESHNERHLTYSEKQFHDLGFETLGGWAEPYTQSRFNAILRR